MTDSMQRTTKGELTRSRILDAAVDEFARLGFRRGSIAAIAREVGITAPAVHGYFPTKEALFDAALEHDAAQIFAMVDTLFDHRPGPAGWGELIPALVAEVQARPLVRQVLENQEPGMLGRLGSLRPMESLRQRLVTAFERGQQANLIRDDVSAAVLATGFETILFSLLLTAVQTHMVESDPGRAAGVGSIMVGGLINPALRSG